MAPPDLTIRPLRLGEVIDWAVALTRRHFRVLFPLMILVQVPALLLYRWHAAGLMEMLEGFGQRGRMETPARAVLASSAVVLLVPPSLEGRQPFPSLASALRALLGRAWPVTSATLLQMAVIAAAPALGAVPGLLLAWRSSGLVTRLVGLSAAVLGSLP